MSAKAAAEGQDRQGSFQTANGCDMQPRGGDLFVPFVPRMLCLAYVALPASWPRESIAEAHARANE